MSDTKRERLDAVAQLNWVVVSNSGGLREYVFQPWRDVFERRNLTWLLIDRELRAKYKGSALGIFWSLARPLTLLLIYFIAIGKFLGAARSIPDFAIFVLIGLTAWSLFSEVVSQSSNVILSNAGIIKKVDVPRELFPLSIVGVGIFNFLIQFVVLVIAMVIVGAIPDWSTVWFALPATFILVTFSTGLAFAVSSINVYVRDLQHLVDVAMSILFWLSPIVYSFKFVATALPSGFVTELYLSNPVTIAVLGFQRALWKSGSSNLANFPDNFIWRLAIMCIVGLIALVAGQIVFSRLKQNFAQEI